MEPPTETPITGVPVLGDRQSPYASKAAVSPHGRTRVARMYLDVANPNDMPIDDTERLLRTHLDLA